MTPQQETALAHPCPGPEGRGDPRYCTRLGPKTTLVVTVDAVDGQEGGSVWHASTPVPFFGDPAAWVLADRALEGVGDSSRGEWVEERDDGHVHVFRRLSAAEEERVGRT